MAMFDKQTLRNSAAQRLGILLKSRSITNLNESVKSFAVSKKYDIFLSHAYLDAELIEELKVEIESTGLTVYVDWIEDGDLNREKVTVETAKTIKIRMQNCKSLIYAFSENSSNSKWMPWELGYFDGYKGKVAVLPILDNPTSNENYKGTEFVGLYPYVVKTQSLWVHNSASSYFNFTSWLNSSR